MSTGMTGSEQLEAAPHIAERHLRADAQRNRERILGSARTLLARDGLAWISGGRDRPVVIGDLG